VVVTTVENADVVVAVVQDAQVLKATVGDTAVVDSAIEDADVSGASVADAGVLVPGGSGRASLTEGSGVVFPIAIAEAGLYRLDLYGLGRTLTARLEDADGWPITKPGPMSRLDRQLAPGRYQRGLEIPLRDARRFRHYAVLRSGL